jgi:hypothetical protein
VAGSHDARPGTHLFLATHAWRCAFDSEWLVVENKNDTVLQFWFDKVPLLDGLIVLPVLSVHDFENGLVDSALWRTVRHDLGYW